MVPSELGVSSLQGRVSVGLRLLDTVPVSYIPPIRSVKVLRLTEFHPHDSIGSELMGKIYPCCSGCVETSSSTWPLLRYGCGNGGLIFGGSRM